MFSVKTHGSCFFVYLFLCGRCCCFSKPAFDLKIVEGKIKWYCTVKKKKKKDTATFLKCLLVFQKYQYSLVSSEYPSFSLLPWCSPLCIFQAFIKYLKTIKRLQKHSCKAIKRDNDLKFLCCKH